MNLETAKELLQQDLDDPGSVDISDLNKAQKLGIEALDFLSQWEQDHNGEKLVILLGETED